MESAALFGRIIRGGYSVVWNKTWIWLQLLLKLVDFILEITDQSLRTWMIQGKRIINFFRGTLRAGRIISGNRAGGSGLLLRDRS